MPTEGSEREKFFVVEIGKADELTNLALASGFQDQNLVQQAALAFYRALAVYPSPVELLGIYDKSVKKEILDIVRVLLVLEPPEILRQTFGLSALASDGGAAAAGVVEAGEADITVE